MNDVVHLELHTDDECGASAFYATLLHWRPERVCSYLTLELGRGVGGGIVECGTPRPLWLPYVAVADVDAMTARAEDLGATVLLSPRSGPTGRRSVVTTPTGGEIAFWEERQ
jgi:predicted enzyme related to lactoylglutathione lyase